MTPANGLQAIGWPPAPPAAWLQALADHPGARAARVAEQHRGGYRLSDGDGELFSAESPPEWQRRLRDPQQRAGVGDWVLVESGQIVALLPRQTALKRGAAGEHYQQQLIAANINTAFVVTGLDADFNPRRIERYLMLLSGSGVQPVVVLTKSDQRDEIDSAMAQLAHVQASGVPVLALNARDVDSAAVLQPWLGAGKTVVLVGSSGAGKSTLTNTLLGRQWMKTGAVRESDSRGRHTTTHRALMPLPSGACLIDTPGMRELKPTGEESLDAASFTDIDTLSEACKFRDCRHEREPGCAVRAAVDSGELDAERLASWRKLGDEVAAAADTLAARQADKTDAKRQTRALNKWLDEKRGGH